MNCIIWNPSGTYEIYSEGGGYSTTIAVAYSIVRGGYSGTGNINADPDLEPHSGYYFLREGSPARDAGVQSATVGGVLLAAPSSCLPLEPWWSPVLPTPSPDGPHANIRDANPDIGAHEFDFATGVEIIEGVIPTELTLSQNYPNPFNPSTTIRFTLHTSLFTSLTIYNVLGQQVATLVNENLDPGTHSVTWDATGFPSGVYFYRLEAVGKDGRAFVETKKMMLVK